MMDWPYGEVTIIKFGGPIVVSDDRGKYLLEPKDWSYGSRAQGMQGKILSYKFLGSRQRKEKAAGADLFSEDVKKQIEELDLRENQASRPFSDLLGFMLEPAENHPYQFFQGSIPYGANVVVCGKLEPLDAPVSGFRGKIVPKAKILSGKKDKTPIDISFIYCGEFEEVRQSTLKWGLFHLAWSLFLGLIIFIY
jgi:hypothetical protein